MSDYKQNLDRFKDKEKLTPVERKKAHKVVSGSVKTKKKTGVQKLTDIFLPEDVSNVKSYIFMDILVPTIKKAISDVVTDGIDMILYGESRSHKKSSSASKISYRNYYESRDSRRSVDDRRRVSGLDYDEIIFETRGDAEEVLIRMDEALDTYGIVSVADLYDLAGLTPIHTHYKYGWTNLRNAEVVRTRNGYTLRLPKALPID